MLHFIRVVAKHSNVGSIHVAVNTTGSANWPKQNEIPSPFYEYDSLKNTLDKGCGVVDS